MTDPPEREQPRNVWVLSLTILCTLAALFSWSRIIALYLRHLGASEVQIGWGFFCYALAYRLPQVAGGLLADRIGRKAIVVLGTFGMAAGYVAVAFAPTWGLLVGAICGCWMIGALQWPALVSLVADSVPEGRRGRAMGLLEACSMSGLTLGPLIGERVYAAAGGLASAWRILLLGTLAVYALCGVVRLALLRDVRLHSAPAAGPVRIPWALLAVPLAATVLSYVSWFLTTDGPIMALYIVDEAGGTPATVQAVGFYGGLAAVAGALVGGWVSDRLGAGRTMMLMTAATLAVLVPLGFGDLSARGRVALFVLLFLPGEAYLVAYNKLITSTGPREGRALAVGLVGTAVGLAASWAMILGGAAYHSNHDWPLAAAACSQALAVALGLGLLRRRYN